MAVVTISRGFGCAGEYVAERIVSRLNYSLINKEIIEYIAILSDTPANVVKKFDEEQHSNINAKLSKYIDLSVFKEMFKKNNYSIGDAESYQPPEDDNVLFPDERGYNPVFDSDTFRNMAERVLKFLADKDNAVILGRGGQVVLKSHPNALHIRLYAPLRKRAEWIATQKSITKHEAEKLINNMDKNRRNYLKHYYDVDICSDELYHLTVNIEKLSIAEATDTVIKLIELKTPTGTV